MWVWLFLGEYFSIFNIESLITKPKVRIFATKQSIEFKWLSHTKSDDNISTMINTKITVLSVFSVFFHNKHPKFSAVLFLKESFKTKLVWQVGVWFDLSCTCHLVIENMIVTDSQICRSLKIQHSRGISIFSGWEQFWPQKKLKKNRKCSKIVIIEV